MLRKLVVVAAALGLLWVHDRPADACGVKLTTRVPRIRRANTSRQPTQTLVSPTPIRSANERTPIKTGPPTADNRGAPINSGEGNGAAEPDNTGGGDQATATPTSAGGSETATNDTEPTPSTDSGADMGRDQGDSGDEQPTPAPQPPKKHHSGHFSTHVFFSNGSADLSDRYRARLKKDAQWLADHSDRTITISGHANATGSADANQAISEQRAEAVKQFLIDQGVDASRIQTEAYGESRPEYHPAASGKNRRVVIEVSQ